MKWTRPAIFVVKAIILALGAGITYIAYKANKRTGARSLKVLSIGFAVITFGALLAGVANQLFSVSLEMGVLINSVLVAIGLGIIMYSLYLER
jgi:hypothetical protein